MPGLFESRPATNGEEVPMRDIDENEMIEVGGGACEPVVTCRMWCTADNQCYATCTVSIVCTP